MTASTRSKPLAVFALIACLGGCGGSNEPSSAGTNASNSSESGDGSNSPESSATATPDSSQAAEEAPTSTPAPRIPASLDAKTVCALQCRREVACDPATDEGACNTDCITDGAIGAIDGALRSLRAEAVPLVYACLTEAAKSCETIAADAYPRDCMNTAAASLPASTEAYRFCDAYGVFFIGCEDSEAYEESAGYTCLYAAQALTDSALEAASSCFQQSCSSATDYYAADECLDHATAIRLENVSGQGSPPPPGASQ